MLALQVGKPWFKISFEGVKRSSGIPFGKNLFNETFLPPPISTPSTSAIFSPPPFFSSIFYIIPVASRQVKISVLVEFFFNVNVLIYKPRLGGEICFPFSSLSSFEVRPWSFFIPHCVIRKECLREKTLAQKTFFENYSCKCIKAIRWKEHSIFKCFSGVWHLHIPAFHFLGGNGSNKYY